MPYTRTKRKYTKDARKRKNMRRHVRRSAGKISRQMITYFDPKRQNALPPVYRTKMIAKQAGFFTSGITASSGSFFQVKLNSPYHCWNTATVLPNPAIGTGSLAIASATNFELLSVGTLYTRFRCIGSRIKVALVPTTFSDDIVGVIVPGTSANPSGGASGAKAQPFAKSQTFAPNKGKVWMNNAIRCSTYIGMPEKAIEYDLSGQYFGTNSADPAALYNWYIYIQSLSNVTTGQVGIEVEIEYDVMLFNNVSNNNIE